MPPVATKVPLLEFAGMASEAGTPRSGVLEVIPTVTAVTAGPLRFTVQVDVPPEFSDP